MSIKTLFEPRSLAVVGVSHTPGKLGYDLFANVQQGYKGKVYAVNPHGGKILGHQVYRTIGAIKKSLDLVIVIVPAPAVCHVIEEAAQVGVRNFVIISAGFAERGETGKTLQRQLDELQSRYKLSYLGPNCLGFINAKIHLNASFARLQIKSGTVGLISQSGAMAVATLDLASRYNLGISKMISIGNKGNLTEIEALEYLAHDPETKVIALYLEQLSRPTEFLQVAQRVINHKPIIVLKAGVTSSGQKAASSHTGSLAQSDNIISAAFHQVGIIRAHTIEELFSFTQALSLVPRVRAAKRTMVISNAGGPAIITADAVQTQGLTLARIPQTIVRKLRQIVPAAASVTNPLDLLGDADLPRFIKVLTELQANDDSDAVVILITPQTMTPIMPLARWLVKYSRRSKKTLVTCFLGHDSVRPAQEFLWKHHIPSFDYPEQAVRYLAALAEWHNASTFESTPNDYQAKSQYLDPYASQNYLRKTKLRITQGRLLTSVEQLRTLTMYPLVLKVVASGIVHKAASQGVAVDLSDSREASAAWKKMMSQPSFKQKKAGWKGFLAQPMVRGGIEFFVGAKRDPEFGTVLIVGLGGSQLELIRDTVTHIGSLTASAAAQLLTSLRNQQLLTSAKRRILIQLLLQVNDLMLKDHKIQELDFNPVLVSDTTYTILDVRIFKA